MIRYLYKRQLWTGCILALLLFVLGAFESDKEVFLSYYAVLYNRTYFLILYVPLFLLGIIPIAESMTVYERMIRFTGKVEFVWKLGIRTLFYAVYFSGIFCVLNLITDIFLCDDNLFHSRKFYFFQVEQGIHMLTGWLLMGLIFIMICTISDNIVIAYLGSSLIIVMLTLAGNSESLFPLRYYISPYELMYRFFDLDFLLDKIRYAVYEILLALFFSWGIYQILKRKDFVDKSKDI